MKALRSIKRIFAIAEKEWIQIRRDTRSLILTLINPVLLILLFGYALTVDVKHVSMAVYNQDRSSFSRQMLERFLHTEYLNINYYVTGYSEIDRLIDHGDAVIAIVIPPEFAKKIKSGGRAKIQVLVDGSNSMSSMVASGYVQAILGQFNIDTQVESLSHAGISGIEPPVDIRTRVWYNEELKSKNFIVPGLIVLILAIISALITSLTISREWERGTMETLITTPVRPYEVISGKVLPYLVIGIFNVCMTFLIGYFVFNIPLRGSFIELISIALLFLVGTSMLGMFISTATKVQVLSIQLAILVTYLPSLILSGFIFPINNMPFIVKMITYLIPAKYMIAIIKGIALKGIAASLMYTQIIFLFIFALLMITLCIKKFRLTVS
jgi:ABC-2 type transport system permease protein